MILNICRKNLKVSLQRAFLIQRYNLWWMFGLIIQMEDSSRDRTVDKFIYSVFSGINWGTQQFTSSCPPREPWTWNKFWNWINKLEKNKEELGKKQENRILHQRSSHFEEETNMEMSTDHHESSRHGSRSCEIKMQDPCAPCCCAIECVEPPACTDVPVMDRTPRCDCEQRRIIKIGPKCCDSTCFEVA